jgi:hypothetical protein
VKKLHHLRKLKENDFLDMGLFNLYKCRPCAANKRILVNKLILMVLIVSIFMFFNACSSTRGNIEIGTSRKPSKRQSTCGKKKRHGPPAHAPAHGYRAKYTYRYYAAAHVYFDIGRELYFYLEGQKWRVSASLPYHIRTRLDPDYVLIDMESDKPYTKHAKHKKHHPHGKTKKYEAGKKDKNLEKKKLKANKKHTHHVKKKKFKTAKKYKFE